MAPKTVTPHAIHVHSALVCDRHGRPPSGPPPGPSRPSWLKPGVTSGLRRSDRFDTAPGGQISYQRGSVQVAPEVAQAIVDGKSVIVIHGVDRNDSGTYDGDVMSELDATLPAEATDPALCGVLAAAPVGGMATGAGGAAPIGADAGLLLVGGALVLAAAGTGAFAARRVNAKV